MSVEKDVFLEDAKDRLPVVQKEELSDQTVVLLVVRLVVVPSLVDDVKDKFGPSEVDAT